MVDLYVTAIYDGIKTIEEVPAIIRAKVIAAYEKKYGESIKGL